MAELLSNAKVQTEFAKPIGPFAILYTPRAEPSEPVAIPPRGDLSREEWNRINCRERYRAKQAGMTLAEYRTAQVLRENPYSELAVSTKGAGIRADQIRRGNR